MSHVVGGVSGARRIFGIWVSLERPRGLEGSYWLADLRVYSNTNGSPSAKSAGRNTG